MLVVIPALGVAVLLSYVLVIGDVVGAFPTRPSEGYFHSPWWVGVPPDTARALTVFQVAAAAGGVAWASWAAQADPQRRGPLNELRDAVVIGFLASSLAWPFVAYPSVRDPRNVAAAVAACVPLWAAAACAVLATAFTFEARAPPAPVVGVLLLSTVVVLVDGVGWTASCIYGAVHQ